MGDMAHLHMHSSYSILDSISKIPDIVKRLREMGHRAAALSDHGTISGVPEFYKECKANGIKPIPACEFYMVPDAEQAKLDIAAGGKRYAYHLILLAMDEEGWKNIKILNTEANKKFYYTSRIDYKDLEKYGNGIIALTACLKGIVPHNLKEGKFDVAAEHAKKLKGIFGDRFYLETQDGGLDCQPEINTAMRALGSRLEIPIVGCQDAHYIDRNDVEAHEALWAIRTYDNFDNPTQANGGDRMYYSTREYWLKDLEHMLREPLTTEKNEQRASTLTQQEIERTNEIADRIKDIKIGGTMHLPRYEYIPDINLGRGCASQTHKHDDHCSAELVEPPIGGETVDLKSFNYLAELVTTGYEKRYKTGFFDAPVEHRERLQKELGDIKFAKLADYFLIIWDIVNWARLQDIAVGPGRGSAAGSMVAYCLGITGIEPLRYGLIWERFFNRGRLGKLADIDLDFSKHRREEVIEYIKNRFGHDKVAKMVSFNTLATKAALKDTAKLLGKAGMSFEEANLMTRFVEDKVENLQDAVNSNDKLKEYSEKFPRLFDIAGKIEGCPKSSGKHASGIIISDEPFDTGCVPLRMDNKDKTLITEWDGDTLDSLGYLKADILGLSTMDVLHGIAKDVNKRYGTNNV